MTTFRYTRVPDSVGLLTQPLFVDAESANTCNSSDKPRHAAVRPTPASVPSGAPEWLLERCCDCINGVTSNGHPTAFGVLACRLAFGHHPSGSSRQEILRVVALPGGVATSLPTVVASDLRTSATTRPSGSLIRTGRLDSASP